MLVPLTALSCDPQSKRDFSAFMHKGTLFIEKPRVLKKWDSTGDENFDYLRWFTDYLLTEGDGTRLVLNHGRAPVTHRDVRVEP